MSRKFLEDFGFNLIATWLIDGARIKPLSLDWQDQSGWLYAFVVGEEVMYVGQTGRVLRSRLDDYSYITEEQLTRIRSNLHHQIEAGKIVEILGWKCGEKTQRDEEEETLICEVDPPWNRTLPK